MKFIKKLEHERLSNLLKKNNIDDVEVAYVGNYDIFFAPTEASKETPIKILSEMYNLKPEECYSFGNEKVDILSPDIAKSFIMRGSGRHFSDYEVEKFSEKGVRFVDNLEEAICRVELNEMQKEKV